MRQPLVKRHLALAVLVGGLAVVPAGCVEPGPVDRPRDAVGSPLNGGADGALRMYVDEYPVVYDDPERFALDVFFENRGEHSLLIIPSHLRRQYSPMDESGEVTYVPSPDPERSTWRGAFTLAPHETRVVTLAGMRDGDGLWKLAQGFYRLSVRYVVTEEFAADEPGPPLGTAARDAAIWRGDLESRAMTVRFAPAAAAGGLPADGPRARPDERRAGDGRF